MSTHRQSIHSIHNKKFWTEFFYLYESLPALWDVNNPLYKNRSVKCDAYDMMVDKLREIEPNADREDVLRKINIFRTNFRRECSRINMSLQEGRHYTSTLWYYDLLCFLQTADSRRDRKRKLENDGEKSIMRKRRATTIIQKSSNQFIVSPKKEILIEYEPEPDFEYDLEEETDFDYAPDELAQAMADSKSESNSEIQNPLDINHCVVENEEDEKTQLEYHHGQRNEFQKYTLHRNIPANTQKIELTADNIAQLTGEVIHFDTPIETNVESEEQQAFHEYVGENEALAPTAQWCIKTTNEQNLTTLQVQKPSSSSSNTTKFVRDVKTMTSSNPSQYCCNKLSESSEILAKSWAVQYDELTPDQKLLARKAINDILFEGCIGHLAMGDSGRVITINGTDYQNPKNARKVSPNEVESSEIYEQSTIRMSSISSTSGAALNVATSVGSTPRVHTNDEWLKL